MATAELDGPSITTHPNGLAPGAADEWTLSIGVHPASIVAMSLSPNTVLGVGNIRYATDVNEIHTLHFTVTNVGSRATNYGVFVGRIRP